MEKQTIKFGTSTSYKAPKCKCVELRIQSILCASPTEPKTIDDIEGDDVVDQTGGWGF